MLQQLRVSVLVLVAASGVAARPRTPAGSSVRVSGTFSSLEYNDEGDDLLGMEVKIVPVVHGYQAAVFVSEGEPQALHVVEVLVSGRSVSFKVREDDGSSWAFQGTVSAQSLKGTITHSLGGHKTVTLPRRCGYWDR